MNARVLIASLSVLAFSGTGCSLTVESVRPSGAGGAEASDTRPATVLTGAAAFGLRAAQLARAQLGAPYRFGGSSPAGFDCSGLVTYVLAQVGATAPRTAAEQKAAARAIPLDSVRPGDLLFFSTSGAAIDHVAIYVGDGLFVHAPRSGRSVEIARLDDSWYAQRFVAAGRLWLEQ